VQAAESNVSFQRPTVKLSSSACFLLLSARPQGLRSGHVKEGATRLVASYEETRGKRWRSNSSLFSCFEKLGVLISRHAYIFSTLIEEYVLSYIFSTSLFPSQKCMVLGSGLHNCLPKMHSHTPPRSITTKSHLYKWALISIEMKVHIFIFKRTAHCGSLGLRIEIMCVFP
jgi:hypothetical protein